MAEQKVEYRITARNESQAAFAAVQRQMSTLETSAIALNRTLGLLGIAVAPTVFTAFITNAIKASAELDDLAEKTGATVEELSRLQQIAHISGTDFGIVETFMIKLAKAMNETGEEGEKVRRLLANLGLSLDELRGKSTAEQMEAVAKAMANFADTGSKAAYYMELTGKNAAQAAPFLKDLTTEQGINARVTKEQAAAAEELGKSWRRLTNEAGGLGTEIANSLVPHLQRIIDRFKTAREASGGFFQMMANEAKRLVGFGDPKYVSALRQAAIEVPPQDIAGPIRVPGVLKPLEKPKTGGGARADPFEQLLRGLQSQLQTTQELTVYEKTLADIEDKRYANLTQAQRTQALELAKQIDLAKGAKREAEEEKKLQEEIAHILEKRNEAEARALEKADQEARAFKEQIIDMIDPLEKFRRLLQQIEESHLLTPEQKAEAMFIVNLQMDEALKKTQEAIKETSNLWGDMFQAGASAFEDAIAGGNKLRDVLKGLETDLIKIITRKLFTEPLGKFIEGATKDFDIGKMLGGIFGGGAAPAGRAGGGAVSAGQPYVVGEQGEELFIPRSGGTIVPSGQLRGTVNNSVQFVFPGIREYSGFKQNEAQIGAWARSVMSRADRFA
jgi:hypothetical protein